MRKDIQDQWVAALRSGEYEQGRGALRTGNGQYCCLGVLCDLADREGVVSRVDIEAGLGTKYDDCDSDLPDSVRAWAGIGLARNSPVVDVGSGSVTLTYLNDMVDYTFNAIADLIEEQGEEL